MCASKSHNPAGRGILSATPDRASTALFESVGLQQLLEIVGCFMLLPHVHQQAEMLPHRFRKGLISGSSKDLVSLEDQHFCLVDLT